MDPSPLFKRKSPLGDEANTPRAGTPKPGSKPLLESAPKAMPDGRSLPDEPSLVPPTKKTVRKRPGLTDLNREARRNAEIEAEANITHDLTQEIEAAFAEAERNLEAGGRGAGESAREQPVIEEPPEKPVSGRPAGAPQGDPAAEGTEGSGLQADITGTIDDIFASFEGAKGDTASDEAAAKRKSRPSDRKIEQVVAQLVRTLTSKKDVTAKELEMVLEVTKNKIVEAVSAQAISIFFVEPDGVHFRHISYSASLYKDDPGAQERFDGAIDILKKTVLPLGTGIVGRVIAENKPHSTLDAASDPDFNQEISKVTGFQVKTMITIPISYDKDVFGAIQCMNKNPASGEEFFSQRDIKLVEEVADYSARVMYMARNPGFKWGDEDVARYVARVAKLEYVDLREVEVDPHLLELVGEDTLRAFSILPLAKLGSATIRAAIDNPLDIQRREAFEVATELEIEELVVSPQKQITDAFDKLFKKQESDQISQAFKAELAERAKVEKIDIAEDADKNSAPVIQLANRIIEDAYARGASDIHIEPFEKEVVIRYRTDGVLEKYMSLPAAAIRPLTARYKIMASLNIAESRLPQDGRIMFKEFTKTGIDIDLRVACGPMVFGEKTVMRILDKKTTAVSLDKMGFSKHNLEMYQKCCQAPYGMILHCGPTGSGKTTTLYAAINFLNTPDMNIQTAEDPVEFMLFGINQMQIKPSIGLTFAKALKCYLRQDPDIILIGEIRDLEVAEIAIEAALTGHEVLSTLHTNDAAGTITRFVEMGVEPYLLTGAILCVCAQRLMRRVCQSCKVPVKPTKDERELLKLGVDEDITIYKAQKSSCNKCNGTGYKGRIGTHELLVMNGPLREVCGKHGVSAQEINLVALAQADMISLFDDAMLKVREGITSIEEALRTVRVDKD